MRRTLVPLALGVWLAASAASAQLSQSFKDWPNGPAGYLMLDSERKAYAQLKTDAEAQAFIDLFWARRDPDLNTVQNEFELEFNQRVAAADKQFAFGKTEGWKSDRGKVLIIMGRPLDVRNVAADAEETMRNRPAFIERGASQVWTYTKDGKPPVKPTDAILFAFAETRLGAGDYVLDNADTRNRQAAKVLAAKVESYYLHPKLTEVPRVGLLPGSKAATAAELAIFDTQPRPWPQGAAVVTASGVMSDTIHPIWVHVQFPDAVPPVSQAVGRVRKAEGGEAAGSFATPVVPISVPGGRAYEFSLPVAAGAWKVDLALSNESGPIGVTTIDAKNEPAPADGPYISPFYWGAETRQSAQAHLGDAFHAGAIHLIPRVDNLYKSDETLTYVTYVVRPTLDEQGQPHMQLGIALSSNGKKQDEQPFQDVQGVKALGDVWIFGQMMPLSGFRRGVPFELEVTLKDAKAGLVRTGKIPFQVVKEPLAATGAATPAPTAAPTAPPKG